MESTQVTLFSGLAVRDILEDTVLPAFTRASGHEVAPTYEPTKVLTGLIADGERPDLVLGVGGALEKLAADGILDRPGLTPLVRSGIGVATAPGAQPPEVGTIDELVTAIRSARSVAYSRTGASGEHFAALLDRFGIADEVNATATVVEKGFTAEALYDGRADLAVQQVIELASVGGGHQIRPLPTDAQHHVDLWLGHAPNASVPARALYDFLVSTVAADAYRAAGLEVSVPGGGTVPMS
ncbi:substrate-binding domain-containing protein [Georgenia sp. Z1491]|uniref:substrate-binding domain-containing protein n=1 Tax=Georgenia sp. Z1491 TaxID=3416707 RepID=UPI003CEEA5B8